MTALYEGLQPVPFRLLQFLDNSGLVLSLKSYCWRTALSYIALSYTWGLSPYRQGRSLDNNYSLMLNDNDLPVQQNLYAALKNLEKRVRTRNQSFWVDALCNNQNDMMERSDEVRHMKEIYEGAASIFAWLGVPYNERETKLAVELMRSFNSYLHDGLHEKNDDIDIVLRSIDASYPGFPTSPESDAYIAWDGIAEMFNQACRHRVCVDISRSNHTSPDHFLLW